MDSVEQRRSQQRSQLLCLRALGCQYLFFPWFVMSCFSTLAVHWNHALNNIDAWLPTPVVLLFNHPWGAVCGHGDLLKVMLTTFSFSICFSIFRFSTGEDRLHLGIFQKLLEEGMERASGDTVENTLTSLV